MTYKESYEKCLTEQELQQEVEKDIYIAILLGNNPDRLEQIRKAAQEVADERNWFVCVDNIGEQR